MILGVSHNEDNTTVINNVVISVRRYQESIVPEAIEIEKNLVLTGKMG